MALSSEPGAHHCAWKEFSQLRCHFLQSQSPRRQQPTGPEGMWYPDAHKVIQGHYLPFYLLWGGVDLASQEDSHTVGDSLHRGSDFRCLPAKKNDKWQQDVSWEKVPQSINFGKCRFNRFLYSRASHVIACIVNLREGLQDPLLFITLCECSAENSAWITTRKQLVTLFFLTLNLRRPVSTDPCLYF